MALTQVWQQRPALELALPELGLVPEEWAQVLALAALVPAALVMAVDSEMALTSSFRKCRAFLRWASSLVLKRTSVSTALWVVSSRLAKATFRRHRNARSEEFA